MRNTGKCLTNSYVFTLMHQLVLVRWINLPGFVLERLHLEADRSTDEKVVRDIIDISY